MDPDKLSTTGNERLPFDVLVQIFEYYLLNESTLWPTETLLLVCKVWNETALQYSPLWTRFKIDLFESNSGSLWSHRLPLRLQRSGSSQPLHIDLRYSSYRRGQWIFGSQAPTPQIRSEDVRPTVALLLNALAGENGQLCTRWKTLHLDIDIEVSFMDNDLVVLSYPMPLLTTLYLSGQMSTGGLVIFPNLPSIRSLTINARFLSNYPDASHATRIGLRNMGCWDSGRSIKFTRVQYLSISRNVTFSPRHQEYPALRTLCLETNNQATYLMEAVMPRLENLIIDFSDTSWLPQASQLRSIAGIRVLHLFGWEDRELNQRPATHSIISKLLNTIASLQTLVVNEFVLSFLIEDKESWRYLFEENTATQVFLRTRYGRMGAHLFEEDDETWISFSSTQDGDKRLTRGEDDSDVILGRVAAEYALPIVGWE
ncbi:hypothetical protein FRC17_005440 [Serendipita sp. 399]|nr:hypothetical protein FRC17_005440 [Serendipita sp. 399]